jgi:hypothetical protein
MHVSPPLTAAELEAAIRELRERQRKRRQAVGVICDAVRLEVIQIYQRLSGVSPI